MVYKELKHLVPLPLAIDDEYLSTTVEGCQPDRVPSRLTLVLSSMKLLEVLDDMRTMIMATKMKTAQAGPSSKEPTAPDPSEVLRINSLVDDILNDMPEHLRADADYSSMRLSQEDIACFRMQGAVLRTRFVSAHSWLLPYTD